MSKGRYAVNKKRFWCKLVVSVVLLCSLYTLISGMVEDAAWEAEYYTTENMTRRCDEYYYDRDFYGLYDFMELYELYGEEYELYWEVVNAYRDYVSWHAWKKAADSGEMPMAAEKEEEMRRKIEEHAGDCRFSKNQKVLDDFAEQTKIK